jgi:hypothetical protein
MLKMSQNPMSVKKTSIRQKLHEVKNKRLTSSKLTSAKNSMPRRANAMTMMITMINAPAIALWEREKMRRREKIKFPSHRRSSRGKEKMNPSPFLLTLFMKTLCITSGSRSRYTRHKMGENLSSLTGFNDGSWWS